MKNTRIPRPIGTTFLTRRYQQTQTNEDRNSVIKHIVNSYCLQGFRINNKSVSVDKLAIMLKTSPDEIYFQISNSSKSLSSILDPTNIENTIKSLISTSISWTFQDRGLILNQLEMMLKSQGESYKPFISSEVNKNLKLLLESNKGLQEAYKSFFTNTNQITNILQIQNNEDENEYLKPDQALSLITKANKELKGQGSGNPNVNEVTGISETELGKLASGNGIQVGDEEGWGFGVSEASIHPPKGKKALKTRGPDPEAERPVDTAIHHKLFEKRRGEPEDEFDTLPEPAGD